MNGGATVSPLFVSNLCCCGHDLAVHVLATFPNIGACGLCNHNHDFTPYNELYPRAEFPQVLPAGSVSPGGFGGGGFIAVTNNTNVKGANAVVFGAAVNLIAAGIKAGMTFTSLPNTPANAASYRILLVQNPTTLTIPAPGLLFNLGTVRCLFQGADASTQGGGLAPNGQRAG